MPNSRPKAGRGRPSQDREISRKKIIDVALKQIRRDGFAKLSMRRMAAELGVTATALYNHFPNKVALLDEVAGKIYDGVPMPSRKLHWTTRLRQWLLDQEIAHLDHPGLASFVLSRHQHSTAAFRWMESVLQILYDGGLDDESQLACMRRVAFLHNPLIYLDAPERKSEARSTGSDRLLAPEILAAYPHFARLQAKWPRSPAREDFEVALRSSIDSLAKTAKKRKRSDL